MPSKVSQICILGDRVSGTSFVQSLITSNTKLKVNSSFGHKHFRQDLVKLEKSDTSNVLFVFITREVIEWLQSLTLNSFHCAPALRKCEDFSKFIRMEWECILDETSNVPQTDKRYGQEMMCERDENGERYANAIQMRTSKIKHTLVDVSSRVEHFEHVRYEDVRDAPQEWLQLLSKKYKFDLKTTFVPITSVRGKGRVPYHKKNYPDVSQEDGNFIIQEISQECEEYLGYL